MANFAFYLASNLALLVVALFMCGLYNRLASGPMIYGAHVFAALAITALAFDAALTFLIFADARNRYGQYSAHAAFFQRAAAYVLAIFAAFAWHHRTRRKHAARACDDKALVIRTSAYSESRLPM